MKHTDDAHSQHFESRLLRIFAGVLLVLGAEAVQAAANVMVAPADYAAANAVLEGNLQGIVRNESVEPHWIGGSGKFWYRRDGNEGPEFVVVTAHGAKSPAFDHTGLARALAKLTGQLSSGRGLPAALKDAGLSDDLTHLTGQIEEKSIDCQVKSLQCSIFRPSMRRAARFTSPRWAARPAAIRTIGICTAALWMGAQVPPC